MGLGITRSILKQIQDDDQKVIFNSGFRGRSSTQPILAG